MEVLKTTVIVYHRSLHFTPHSLLVCGQSAHRSARVYNLGTVPLLTRSSDSLVADRSFNHFPTVQILYIEVRF